MSKRIHILYTIPNFDTAGSGKIVYDLAKNIDTERFRVSIACNHNRGTFFKQVEGLGIPIYLMDVTISLRPYSSLLKRMKPFKNFLKEQEVDVVHSWHWSSDWTEALACRMAKVPFVYTKKSMSWGNIHWKLRSFLSSMVVTVNSDMHAFFPYKKQQRLIPFGLDLNYYDPKQFSIQPTTVGFKIVTVANLVAVKHLETLIEAIKKIETLPIHLDIVGDTETDYADRLKIMIENMNLEAKISMLGKVSDVRPLLASSNMYVISSKQEGMPMALVEAMAMALPVLGSEVPGIRYVLKDFKHLLFPISEAESLAKKIQEMYNLTEVERQSLGKSLRTYCLNHFSLSTFIKAHETMYLELVNP